VGLFFLFERKIILKEALIPKLFKILIPCIIDFKFSTAFHKEQPFYLMISCQHNLNEHNSCSIDTNRNEHNTLSSLSGHEEVNVKEEESKYSIIHQPVSYE